MGARNASILTSMDVSARFACAAGLIGMLILAISGLASITHRANTEVEANPTLAMQTWVVGSGAAAHRIRLEVARTREEQRRGLMARNAIGAADGMAFPRDGHQASFWMHGTRIPLDIVYVSPSRHVMKVVHGEPMDDLLLPSSGPVGLVIEVEAGHAPSYGLVPGAAVTQL